MAEKLQLNNNRRTENGFTLLESLIVLSLASVLLTVLFTTVPPAYTHLAVRQKQSTPKDIQLAQETAIAEHKRTKITFLPKEHKYKLQSGGKILERSFDSLHITLVTLPESLEFNEKAIRIQEEKDSIERAPGSPMRSQFT